MERSAAPFDARAFWLSLVACAFPPLAGGVAILVNSDQAISVLLPLWGLVYLVSFVWMLYAFVTGDSARGLALILGMIAAIVVGPGSCLMVLGAFA